MQTLRLRTRLLRKESVHTSLRVTRPDKLGREKIWETQKQSEKAKIENKKTYETNKRK